MRRYVVVSLAVLLAPCLAAQQRDSTKQPSDTADAERLRSRIEQAFSDRVQRELSLTPDQTTKLRASQERFSTRRRQVMEQQMQRRRGLEDQMQPGVAANSDSVRKLLDGMQAGRAEMVRIDQDQSQEMSRYLSPLQQARYQQMRARLMQRAAEIRMERRGGRGLGRGGGPGIGPRRGTRGGGRRGIRSTSCGLGFTGSFSTKKSPRAALLKRPPRNPKK